MSFKFKLLTQPIIERQGKKIEIEQELEEYKKNFPTQKKKIPGMQREKDFHANIEFIDNVVETMKYDRDPIRRAKKQYEDVMA